MGTLKKISLFSLVLLVISAIDSIRNLPASALFGSSLIFFFLFAALIFLIPTALVSAELSSAMPDKGGVYHWVTKAFGEKVGFLAIWFQWINTMIWYPTILSFIAGTAAYLFDPELAHSKGYLLTVILCVFWGMTLINLFGIQFSARVSSICGVIGTMLPMIFLIILGFIWFFHGEPLQVDVRWDTIFPTWENSNDWVALTAIMASYLGIELAGVHVNDIREPQKNFPLAMLYSGGFILFSMLFGSLAIAFVLPAEKINLVAGVMQVFTNFFELFHMSWCIPLLVVLIVVGSTGGLINWLISPAKGLLHAAEFGFLPPFFSKKNRYGVAHNILIMQACIVSVVCVVFWLVPSVNAFYWFLTGLSTDLYVLMYVLMFFAAFRLHHRFVDRPLGFKIPGRNIGMWTTCLFGCFGCLVTLIVSFFPPEELNVSIGRYALMIAIGNLVLTAPVLFFYGYRKARI